MPIFTPEIAQQAIEYALYSLPPVMNFTEREYQSLEDPQMHIAMLVGDGSYGQSYGDEQSWPGPFQQYAEGKATLSYDREKPTAKIRVTPQLLVTGDVLLTGGVYLDGIAVGVSGWEPESDELLAGIIAYWIQFLCKRKAQQLYAEGKRIVE